MKPNERNKIMYCEMPKVGSTNWKRVFMKLTNPKYENIPIEGEVIHHSFIFYRNNFWDDN